MFQNPEIVRQVSDGRLDERRQAAARRRIAAPARRGRRFGVRSVRVLWFGARRQARNVPEPATVARTATA
jgi:hypothetical protein